YQWLREPILEDLSILPEDLREFLGLLYSPEEAQERNGRTKGQVFSLPRDLTGIILDKALKRIGQEGRNDAGFWLVQQLRDNRITEAQARSIMLDYVRRVPAYNTKGQFEPYTEAEAFA